MSNQRQAWLAALGTSENPLPDAWVTEKPDRLREWPLLGGRYQPGINGGDHLLLYAAKHKKLVGAALATGRAADADASLRMQTYLAIPLLPFAPDWEVLGIKPTRLEGRRAITISDEEYDRGLQALISVVRTRFND